MISKKTYALLSASYMIASIGDNVLTYYYVVLKKMWVEVNPFRIPYLSQPLWAWFIPDALMLFLALMITWVFSRWMSKDPRTLRIAQRAWVILLGVTIARFLPLVNNVLLLFGIQTPLPKVFEYF